MGCVCVDITLKEAPMSVALEQKSLPLEVSFTPPIPMQVDINPTTLNGVYVNIHQDSTPMSVGLDFRGCCMQVKLALICDYGRPPGYYLWVEEGVVMVEEGYAKVEENIV